MKAKDKWRRKARCRGMDAELFFPPERSRKPADWSTARVVCAGCPVRAECREDAIATRELSAFRGGLDPEELEMLAERRSRVR